MMKGDPESQADEFNCGPRNSTISGNRTVTTRDSFGEVQIGGSSQEALRGFLRRWRGSAAGNGKGRNPV